MVSVMALHVVIVQHGEKERGSDDPGLTPAGIAQANAVARSLAAAPVGAVFTSPLRRARETADPLARACGVAVTVEPRLLERMNWTSASGLSIEEFLTEWQKATVDRDYVPRTGESSHAVAQRMVGWLREMSRYHDGLIVAVSHGGATVDMLRTLLSDPEMERRAQSLVEQGVPCGALTEVTIDSKGDIAVVHIAVTDHLQSAHRHRVV